MRNPIRWCHYLLLYCLGVAKLFDTSRRWSSCPSYEPVRETPTHTHAHRLAHTLSCCRRRQLLLKIVRNSKRDYETHAVPAASNLSAGLEQPTLASTSTSSNSSSPHHTTQTTLYSIISGNLGQGLGCSQFFVGGESFVYVTPSSIIQY